MSRDWLHCLIAIDAAVRHIAAADMQIGHNLTAIACYACYPQQRSNNALSAPRHRLTPRVSNGCVILQGHYPAVHMPAHFLPSSSSGPCCGCVMTPSVDMEMWGMVALMLPLVGLGVAESGRLSGTDAGTAHGGKAQAGSPAIASRVMPL